MLLSVTQVRTAACLLLLYTLASMQAIRSLQRLFGRRQASSYLTPARKEVLNYDVLRLVIEVSDEATLAILAATIKRLSDLALNRLYEVLDLFRLCKMEHRADWVPHSWCSLGMFCFSLGAQGVKHGLDLVAHT